MEPLPLQLLRKLKNLGVITVYLFGSHATGKAGPQSDFDIAVQMKDSIPTRQYLDIRLMLMPLFAQFFKDKRVDVIALNEAPPLLAMNVIDEGKILFEADHDERVALEVSIMRSYLDRLPYEERSYDSLLKSL